VHIITNIDSDQVQWGGHVGQTWFDAWPPDLDDVSEAFQVSYWKCI